MGALPILAPAAFARIDCCFGLFITGTSLGNGGNLGGLSGADANCQALAAGVDAGGKVWRANRARRRGGFGFGRL